MGEGHLRDFMGVARLFGGPVPERRAEPVCGQIAPAHPLEDLEEGHVGQWAADLLAGKYEITV